jgi:histidinol phosphatase-like PHP family hydrolase
MIDTRLLASKHRGVTRRQFLALSAAAAACAINGTAEAAIRIRQDWHMHTHLAGGKPDATVPAMIAVNEAYGLDLMGISEHIDRLDQRDEFKTFIAANRAEAQAVATPMTVMIGTESTMIDPETCAVGHEIAAQLDYVMVSCNHYHLRHVQNPNPRTPDAYAKHYLDMLIGATQLGYADTIGHPFYHQKLSKELGDDGLHAVLEAYDETRLIEVLKTAARVDMAFEINPRHADLALQWFRDLVQEARRHGVKFTLGTDAHDLASLGYPPTNGRTCADILNDLTITNQDLKWVPIPAAPHPPGTTTARARPME